MPDGDNSRLVSVIIPTYNRSQLLRLTVESVLAQTYPNIEIIVVDDGSTDDTHAVMAQYAGRITFIKQAHQSGSTASNEGFRVATGEFINFLDHDDLMMPTKIERQASILASRPEVSVVHCGYYNIDKHGNRFEKSGLLPEGHVLEELLIFGCFIWSGAPLIRRQCLERVGGYDESLWSSDWDMWLRLALASYQFACVQEPLGAYRILPDSQMSNVAELERGGFAILDKIFADPGLPVHLGALKKQVYAKRHLWVSCKYYAADLLEDAQRNMTEALALSPQLLAPPENLLTLFRDEALDPRINDPVKFITVIFDHLPPPAYALHQHRARLLSQVSIGSSLRNYAFGDLTEAKRQLAESVRLSPATLDQPEDFAKLLYRYAMRYPTGTPLSYVDTVLQNLPTSAQRFISVRKRILGEINIGCAFQDYFAGRRSRVVRQVITGLRYHPSSLGNRGVVSILLRSLLGRPV